MRLACLLAIATLVSAGCKERNPRYCPGHLYNDCDAAVLDAARADAATDAPPPSGDGHDGNDANDAKGASDVAADAGSGCAASGCADAGAPVCDTSTGACVQCLKRTDCTTTAKPACDTASKTCVECVASKDDCSGAKPICDTTAACRACKTDAECVTVLGADPGVCAPDGHCATSADVVYAVQPLSDCSAPDGTLAKPYCKAQDAITAARVGSKRFVVLRGGFGSISVTATSGRISVIGQGGAMIGPGLDLYGIDVSGNGDLLVRDVKITGGTSATGAAAHVSGAGAMLTLVDVQIVGNAGVGVVAEGSAALTMNRCLVKGGGFGTPAALKTTMSSFHITNSVFANSSLGAQLDSNVPGGGDRLFKNNTIVSNAAGVACSGLALTGLVFSGNTNDALGCMPAACCMGDPMLTADYHLGSGSLCIDQLPYDPQVPDDIDGQLRPMGAMSNDCGADEYVAP